MRPSWRSSRLDKLRDADGGRPSGDPPRDAADDAVRLRRVPDHRTLAEGVAKIDKVFERMGNV